MRKEFSKKTKRDAFVRAKGNCEECNERLQIGKFHFDHDIPDANGGSTDLDNCRVLCVGCHRHKTGKADMPAIAKTKRIRDAHLGIRKPSSFSCSRSGKWKKKLNGKIVLR